MRVLIINYEFPPVGGGGGIATYYIARELVRKGHTVSVLTSHFRGLRWREDLEGIRLYRVPVLRRRRDSCSVPEMATFILTSCPVLVYLLLKQRYDILHVFFGIPSGPLGYLAKKLFHLPYIIRMGGGDVPGFRPFQYKYLYKFLTPALKVLWRNAAFLVANSDGLRDLAHQMFPALPIEVIPNGVDTAHFTNRCARVPADVVRVLFVSRLILRKGLQYLIEALPELRAQSSAPFVITVIGDGPDREALMAQADALGVNDLCQWLGYVEHEKLPEYYLDADLFVLPSLAEGMPNVVLEALGSGLPIVATRVAGSEELVRHGENGFLADTRDPHALTQALRPLINDPVLRLQMGQRSQAIAREYTWELVTQKYLDLYHQAINGRK